MNFEITKEEIEIIQKYQNNDSINQLLENDVETDIALISQENDIKYGRDKLIENINIIKEICKILAKSFFSKEEKKDWCFFKSANFAEIEKMGINSSINKFLLLESNKEKAEEQFSNQWSRFVLIDVNGTGDVPFIDLTNILEKENSKILVAPFTKVIEIREENQDLEDSRIKRYHVKIENQKCKKLFPDEKEEIFEHILKNADLIEAKLKSCVELDNENMIHYENIRKLEQLLAKHNITMEQPNYETDTTEAEKQSDLDDISRINFELNTLRDTAAKVFALRKENSEFVSDWKKDVATYLMSEWDEILETASHVVESKMEKMSEEQQQEEKEIAEDVEISPVKKECLENIDMVEKLLENIKKLISKQQNHARIAENLDSNYKALNNGFQMKNYAEELESLVKSLDTKVDNINPENTEDLDKISKVNIQISTLLNYLNNPKNAVSKKLKRFDEINIIEENELKREIAETLKNIRCEAELKKLNDDIEIIETQNIFQKFIGKLTGKNKLDEVKLDQIQIRKNAIRKTFKTKMPLARNYSIHELVAEIEMFIDENADDELVIQDVNDLRKFEDILKKNFVVNDSKVIEIVNRKIGKNLPLTGKKVTKRELIEMDTYRFLNKYGYDKSNDYSEPDYQDTLASEIKRIVDYIKSSGIL